MSSGSGEVDRTDCGDVGATVQVEHPAWLDGVCSLLEVGPFFDGLCAWDLGAPGDVWSNRELRRLLECDHEEAAGASWQMAASDCGCLSTALEQIDRAGEGESAGRPHLVHCTRRDGSLRWLHVRAVAAPNAGGADQRAMVAAFIAIEQIELAVPLRAAATRDAEVASATHAEVARSRELTESLPHLLWTCRSDGYCDYLSPQWCAYTGTPEAEQLGYGWLAQIHPEDRLRTQERWEQCAATATVLDVEFRIRRFDGSYRWFKTRASPVTDESGRVTKWYGSNTDVQDLHDSQLDLARVNEELEARVRDRTQELVALNAAQRDVAGQLALAQKLTHVGSWFLDRSTGRVEWSAELFRIVGLDEGAEAPGVDAQERLFTAESWERAVSALARSLTSGQGYELQLDVVRPSGEVRRTIARAQAILGADGSIERLIGTLQDVTELSRARDERDRAAERAQLATSAAKAGVWDWNVQCDALVWDETMYTLYGRNPASFTATIDTWRACLHTEDRESASAAMSSALAARSAFDTAFRVVRPSGEVRHIRGIGHVYSDDTGRPVRMIGTHWDVTTQRQTELALRSSEALLRQFVRHAPAAIAMLDQNLCYLQASEKWILDYKLDGRDIIGRSHYDVFPDIPERWKLTHQRVLAGDVEKCAEDPFPRANGETEWLQWEARPWLQPDGTIGGLIFFTQVITARKELELLLELQKSELERSNRDLEQFAYAASHDLQEPLRAVAGCAQILQRNYRDKLDSSADDLIIHIVDGAQRMRALIQDLLSYSRVSTRSVPLKNVATGEVVRQALANLRAALDEAGARVELGELPTVQGDGGQLTLLFQNLIGNALKYRRDETPIIQIAAHADGNELVFAVSDNGMGIEASYFERIFVLFQRLHTREEYPGTGIGLALCKKIVERHGGRIWVDSVVDEGSTFSFSLCRCVRTLPSQAPEPLPP